MNDSVEVGSGNVRHVCGISGGKDSAALAIYLKQKGTVPNIEYFFSDTGAELPEIYEFLDKLEAYLGQEIVRIGSDKPFDHHLKVFGGFLPSPQQRWCTREMKIKPFEEWVGDDEVYSYVGIRADESRDGYISRRPSITPIFPFKEDGIVRDDVFRILEETVGVPEYYKWRSRSGCYFCFFQRKKEWVGLKENHPELFEEAKKYEKFNEATGQRYTWVQGESLGELEARAEQIKSRKDVTKKIRPWQEIMDEEDDGDDDSCLICSL